MTMVKKMTEEEMNRWYDWCEEYDIRELEIYHQREKEVKKARQILFGLPSLRGTKEEKKRAREILFHSQ